MPVPDPITRQEQFLAAAAGGSADNLPDPITREEVYLKAIADNAGGGGGGGGGSSTLSGLTDVDLTNPADGQTLVYNATAQKWVNGSGGGVLVVRLEKVGGDVFLDHTYAEIAAAAPNVVLDDPFGQMHTLQWLNSYGFQSDTWGVAFGASIFTTSSESGYPKLVGIQ